MKSHLAWLRGQVVAGITSGTERGRLQQANLIPPGLLAADPDTHIGYLVMRENVINRIYDQNTGYWRNDLEGMAYLTRADRAAALIDYAGLTEGKAAQAGERLIADGKHEAAADLVGLARQRFPDSERLARVERTAYLKLMEKYQDIDPFKFIVYSSRARVAMPAMGERQPNEKQSRN
jgi:hypothetical protein